MPKGRRNGPSTNKRPHIASILLAIALKRWEDDRWTVRYNLHPHKGNPRILAEVDFDSRIADVYPHPAGAPLARTGLHEVCHVGFDLDGDNETEAYALEEWIWKRLTKKERGKLSAIFEQPLNS